MALELATAIVRLRANSEALNASLVNAKRRIRTELGAMRVVVNIIPVINRNALEKIQTQLGAMGAVGGKGSGGVGSMAESKKASARSDARAGGGKGAGGPHFGRFIGASGGGFDASGRPSGPTDGGGRFAGQGAGGTNMSRNASIMSGASRVATGKSGLSGNIAGFAKGSFQIATGILGAQAALGTLAIPVKAIQTAAEFESSMIRVEAVTGATADQMDRLEKTALAVSKSTRFTANDVGAAMVVLGQKGLSGAEVETAAPVIIDLAAAGRVSPEQAADILVGITNAMQLGVDDLRNTADVLTRIAVGSSADIQSVGEAFKFVGPLAELAGLEIEEVAGSLALLSNVNLGGSLGGTGFKRIITTFANPAKIKKLNELLGVQIKFKNALGDMRPLADIIDDINKVLDKSSSGFDKAGFAVQIFGERAGPQFAAFLQQGGEALREQIAMASEFGVTAKKVGAEDMEGLLGAFRELKSVLETVMIEAVEPFTESLIEAVEALGDVALGVGSLSTMLLNFKIPKAFDDFFEKLNAEGGTNDSDEVTKALNELDLKNENTTLLGSLRDEGKVVRLNTELEAVRLENEELDKKIRTARFKANALKVAVDDKREMKNRDAVIEAGLEIPVEKETGMAGFVAMSRRVEKRKAAVKKKESEAAAEAAEKAEEEASLPVTEKKKASIESRFVGIQAFQKQIQLAILNKDKDKTQEDIAASVKKSSTSLVSIDRKIGDTEGVFG